MNSDNPLLQAVDLLPYSTISVVQLQPAIERVIADNETALAQIIQNQLAAPTWEGLVLAVDELDRRLDQVGRSIFPLSFRGGEWSEAFGDCYGMILGYQGQTLQNLALYQCYKALANSTEAGRFDNERKVVLQRRLRDFRLAGSELSVSGRKALEVTNQTIATLEAQYGENLHPDSNWSKLVTDESLLQGIPEANKALIATDQGWLVKLDENTYNAIVENADRRTLREAVYTAYTTRGSSNAEVLRALLRLRHEKANLLGYSNYAQLSLETKGAESSDEVLGFLRDLVKQSKPLLEREAGQLKDFAAAQGVSDLQAWDYEYYVQQYRQKKYGIAEAKLREYFPVEQVLERLLRVVEKLFGVTFVEQRSVDSWHEDVRVYEVQDNGKAIGYIAIDLFARPGKPDQCFEFTIRSRHVTAAGEVIKPINVLFCNFLPAVGDAPALLSFLELRKLFHEFGHCLHQVFSRASNWRLSHDEGIGRDEVEFRGKILEQWALAPECLLAMSAHYKTGKQAPRQLINDWLASQKAQSGLKLAKELRAALIDLELHLHANAAVGDAQAIADRITSEVLVLPLPVNDRFANGFDYMVTGYEAGYFVYQWAELFAADTFARFEEEGVFNPLTGRFLRNTIFAPGASQPMSASFQAFRGRPVSNEAFLRLAGLL